MNILDLLSKVALGIDSFVKLCKQASSTKETAQKAEQLAHNKQLPEAAKLVEKTLAVWYNSPNFWERMLRRLLLGNLLTKLKEELRWWQQQIAEAYKLADTAKALFRNSTNPLETQDIAEAIALYQSSVEIVFSEEVSQAIQNCQRELQQRQQFQGLVKEAQKLLGQQFFKKALHIYRQAEQLYSTDALKAAIAKCFAQLNQEETYETALKQAQQAFRAGKLKGAIALLESALTNFSRSDGKKLLEELRRNFAGKEKFWQGLKAEQVGALAGAAAMYKEAKALLDDPTECQIRLGLVAIKTNDYATALSHLQGVQQNQAAYLRGFAYAKQGELQQANREWQPLTQTTVAFQKNTLKSLAQRQRLIEIKNIEQLVNAEKLEKARATSQDYIKKFGSEPLVQNNLDEHIQPRIESAVWQGINWGTIVATVERNWIEQPNSISLHNWVVATYYHALSEPQGKRDFNAIKKLIVALSTALANLPHDPSLKNVPWLGNNLVDHEAVSSDLQRRLETAIDTFKDQNLNQYLELRDLYRQEAVALRLMGAPPKRGMKVNDVFITPGCHERYYTKQQSQWQESVNPSPDILRSLYTPWGLAVAACVEGDTQRALQIKPTIKPTNEAQSFAQKFIDYHQGCSMLQQQKWRGAIVLLKQAQSEIKVSTEWQKEVDRLCGLQRQNISEFKEHLEFAQSWYELLDSQSARSYLAEYKAEQVREEIANEKMSFSQALQELQKIKQIDDKNPIVSDLVENIEISQEMQTIFNLIKSDRLSDAVNRAKQSKHQQVRFTLAKMYLEFLIKGAQTGEMPRELIYQLGKWAYELCPNEPDFQDIYRELGLR